MARHAVGELAPAELPFFTATSDAYFQDPHRALTGGRRTDDVLGSGFDVVVTLISPVALAVAAAVYEKLTEEVGGTVVRGGKRLGQRLWRRLRRRAPEPGPPPRISRPLTAEQRAALRAVAQARARALGLPEEKVQLLVGAILDGVDRDD